MAYIDFHIDTLMMYFHGYEGQSLYESDKMVDLKRMKEANCYAQFFATFFPPEDHMDISDEEYRANLYTGLTEEIKKHSDIVSLATSYTLLNPPIINFFNVNSGEILKYTSWSKLL